MKNIYTHVIDRKNALYGALGVLLITPGSAFAQGSGINGLGTNLKTQFQALWNIGSWLFMAVGIFYVGTGIMRLKAAVDSQGQQVKYSEGIWRIGLGSAFLMMDFIINSMIGTVTGTNGSITNTGGNLFE